MSRKDKRRPRESCDSNKLVPQTRTTPVSTGGDPEHDQNDTVRHQKRVHQWQRIHIALFMGAFLCSLAGILAFGMVLKNFEVYCPLFANVSVVLKDASDVTNVSIAPPPRLFFSVNHAASSWGSKKACDFCLFTTVSSFIYAFLWLWIFCSFSRKVEDMDVVRRGSPWKMVPPALFITCVFSLLVLTSAVLLTVGQASLCNSLERGTLVSCSDAQELPWKPGVIKMANFHTLFTRAELAIWLAAACWFLNSALLCCRCILHPDVATTGSVVPRSTSTT
ncbi:transmembrane protein 179B isoform X1 [Amblyomma americanum]